MSQISEGEARAWASAPPFKVGDRVVVTDKHPAREGQTGTVTEQWDDGNYPYRVEIDPQTCQLHRYQHPCPLFTVEELRHDGWTVDPPPEPRYYVQKSVIDDGRWLVFEQPRRFVVSFSSLHPDPEAAAIAEVRRLNDGDYGGDA